MKKEIKKMIRTIHTVNRSMNVLQKRQENTSGNIANSNTSGYKFKSIMQSTLEPHEMINYSGGINRDKRQVLGEFIFGNQVDESITNTSNGTPYETGNFTDFSIQGEGLFTLQLANGERGYTRNGNFTISEDGSLVTQSGDIVLGIGADNTGPILPIFINPETKLDHTGAFVDYGARLLRTDPNSLNDLRDRGDTVFTATGNGTPLDGANVMQNYLESSNVDFTKEIIDMIQVSREFESNQKMIQAADETLSKAVNEIGRL